MEDTTITCTVCEESFDSDYDLLIHQQTVHAADLANRKRSRTNHSDEDEQETAA
jgi:hypothetical protein